MIGNNAEEELIKLPWNSPKQRYTLGVSLGYVQKNYVRTGGADTHKGWRKSYGMAGVQAGVRVNPQFDKGWGFNTGLFYEFFYEPTQECIIPTHYGKGDGVKVYLGDRLEVTLFFDGTIESNDPSLVFGKDDYAVDKGGWYHGSGLEVRIPLKAIGGGRGKTLKFNAVNYNECTQTYRWMFVPANGNVRTGTLEFPAEDIMELK